MSLPAGLTLVASLALPTQAQSGASGSESWHSTARSVPTGGGAAASETLRVESEISLALGGPVAASESYVFQGGAVWTGPELAPGGPVVFGVAGAHGPATPDGTEIVIGLGFETAGAGILTAAFDGVSTTAATVLGDTRLALTPPAGAGATGNPKALVDLELTSDLGSSRAGEAYAYTPALVQLEPVHVGGVLHATLIDEPGVLHVLAYGIAEPGLVLPVGHFEGALELIYGLAVVGAFQLAPSGYTDYALPVPNNPALAGMSLDLQAFSLDSLDPAAGSFSNLTTITIQN
ncbi:MAG: hypothetical protein AAF682_23645 [Planctomycetota bacterium]